MAQSAPTVIASHNPFDDINAIGRTTDTVDTPGQVSAENSGETEPTGVWLRDWYYIFNKIFKVLKPAHNVRHRHPRYPDALLAIIATSSCFIITTLGSTAQLRFIPLVLFITAIACAFVSLWALIYLTMPLCIATYIAMFVVVLVHNMENQDMQPQQRTAFVVAVVLWIAFVPLIGAVTWSFRKWGRAMFKKRHQQRHQQQQQQQPPLPSIELDQLPRTPSPVVLRHSHHLGAGPAFIQTHVAIESSPLFVVGDDGFQEVREFV